MQLVGPVRVPVIGPEPEEWQDEELMESRWGRRPVGPVWVELLILQLFWFDSYLLHLKTKWLHISSDVQPSVHPLNISISY